VPSLPDRGPFAWRLPIVLAVALAGSCSGPPTQVVVRLATNLDFPTEFDALRLQILDDEGELVREQDVLEIDIPADGAYHEIATFGVVPRGGDAGRRFEVRAQARLGGRELFTTRAISGFVDDTTIRLDVFLPELCLEIAASCEPDETCGVDGCVDPFVDPGGLPVYEETSPGDPVDPVDPRPAVERLHLRWPMTARRVMTRSPTLQFDLPVGATEPGVELCADAACATVLMTEAAPGGSAQPALPASVRRQWFWRARATVDDEIRHSVVAWFEVPGGAPLADIACGQRFDFDGDGRVDSMDGWPSADSTGRVLVQLNDAGGLFGGAGDVYIAGASPGARLSQALDAAGDLDGDGRGDLVAGAPAEPGGGAVFIAYGGQDRVETLARPVAARFGAAVAGIGDLEGDGYADVAVADAPMDGRWTIYVFAGGADGLDPSPRHTLVADAATASDVVTLAGGGDLDADRRDDLVVGLPNAGDAGVLAWVSSADPDAGLRPLTLSPPLDAGAQLGWSIAVGNYSGNARCDLAVGAPGQTSDTGAAFIFGSDTGEPTLQLALTGGSPGERNAEAMTMCDLGYDGFDELIVSGPAGGTQRRFDIWSSTLPDGMSSIYLWERGADVDNQPRVSCLGDFTDAGVTDGGGLVVSEAGADITYLRPLSDSTVEVEGSRPSEGVGFGFTTR